MYKIFQQVGYVISPRTPSKATMRFYCIDNPDGSPRWIWPAESRQPVFLKFYHTGSWRSKAYQLAIQAVFYLGLQRLFFRSEAVHLQRNSEAFIDLEHPDWALFMGTPGPNNKAVLFDGHYFYKISPGSGALYLLRNEAGVLFEIAEKNINGIVVPRAGWLNGSVLQLEDVSKGATRLTTFSHLHLEAVSALNQATAQEVLPNDTALWQQTLRLFDTLVSGQDERIPAGLLRKMATLIGHSSPSKTRWSLAHGDFTPWNMFERNGQLVVYDWEMALPQCPPGYDAFHWLVQNGILVEKKPWSAIKADIERRISPEIIHQWAGTNTVTVQDALTWYLVINTVRYLHIYSRQPQWHTQVQWLLQTWNEAFSDLLQAHYSPRELVLMDLFDFLTPIPYAALKIASCPPEQLSDHSDIDLCIGRNKATDLIKYLKKHPLTVQVHRSRKSFMDTVALTLRDGSRIHLDLIAELRWKYLKMMDTQTVIEQAVRNEFGVKTAKPCHNALYLAYFYGLNGEQVPLRYQNLRLELEEPSGRWAHNVFAGTHNTALLRRMVGQQPGNQGINRWLRLGRYLLDTVKDRTQGHGQIVTFSGVDGAGKSTVIEQVRHTLEKKFRKKVVVLRHRPSLLPILSAWKAGKTVAEQAAATRLPRQGDNHSIGSSILRFAYYYCDYLIGQFYVQLRYVWSGYVVLYDRYYFDFINDSIRSNIRLPQRWMKAGYPLLLKPDVNFFLYASPEVILKRKQELDAPTIQSLTSAYLDLFAQLGRPRPSRYVALENIDLNNTVSTIISKLTL